MRLQRRLKPKLEISLIPLINVVFLLLIFFLIAGTIAEQQTVEVNPPDAKTGEKPELSSFTIMLTEDGMIFLNDIPVTMQSLQNELAQIAKQKRYQGKPLVIKADASLVATRLVKIIAIADKAGVYDVSLVTEAR